ncbi:MAG: hypothetical protein LAP85_20660 [Acidobacteriia bacterium]|nr:hypothetical protein [Terriglobia bacterium]
MSNDAEMAAPARMMAEFADQKRHLKTVKSEAHRIGEQLMAIGKLICDHPSSVTIDPESYPFLNVMMLQAMIEDCRIRENKVSDLRAQLISMGLLAHPVPPSLRRG